MDSKVNYTVVGIFVVVLSAAFIVMFFWLSATRHDKIYNTYLTYVHEDVTGLTVQGAVRYNGVQVGYVSAIDLDSNNPQLVRLTLKVEQGTPVTTSTVVTLLPMGITGVVYVGLKAQTPNAPLLGAKAGEPFPIIPFQPSFFMQLGKVLPELTNKINTISQSVSQILDEKNRQALSDSLQNISEITKNISKNSQKLDAITDSLDELLKNTAEASKSLPQTMKEFDVTMKNVQQVSQRIDVLSKNANLMMSQTRVLMGNLNDQLMPSAQQTLVNLNQLSGNLVGVSEDLQRNPSMFIRGKQATSPGPGEASR